MSLKLLYNSLIMQVKYCNITIATTAETYFRIWANSQGVTRGRVWVKFSFDAGRRSGKIPYGDYTCFTAHDEGATVGKKFTRSNVNITLCIKKKEKIVG